MPLHIGSFVLSNCKGTMNNFFHANNGFNTTDLCYEDTDSMYIENKYWDKLDKSGLVDKN